MSDLLAPENPMPKSVETIPHPKEVMLTWALTAPIDPSVLSLPC